MSFIDILILIVFAASILIGLKRGFIKQLGSILGLVLGILGARMFGPAAAGVIIGIMPAESAASPTGAYAASVIGSVAIFLIIYFVTALVAHVTRMAVNMVLLGPVDRILGALLSLVKWFTGLSIVLNIFAAVSPGNALFSSSRIGNGMALETVMSIAPWLLDTIKAPFIGN